MVALRGEFSVSSTEREAQLKARKQLLLEQARHRFLNKESAKGNDEH